MRFLTCALLVAALLSGGILPPPAHGFDQLGEPALNPGENVRLETGIVNNLVVDRYTWRDSTGHPRSASLVQFGQATGGYAVQFTYQIQKRKNGPFETFYLDPPPFRDDGGFGYFVSHELFRIFDADVCSDGSNNCTIASLHGEDDSPRGFELPGSGHTVSVSATEAIHEFTQHYPHWGTIDPIADPSSDPTPSALAAHAKYDLVVTMTWTFTSGQDYPLWSVTYDLSAAPVNRLSIDMRGPYGSLAFDDRDRPLKFLEWGDQYVFRTRGSGVSTKSKWTWDTLNTGARYNLLVAGQFEMGLVQTIPYSASRFGSQYSDDRGLTSTRRLGCPDTGWRMPCDFEWTYQSVQYEEFGGRASRVKKIAWGTAPFLGTSKTSDETGEPFVGYPVVSYSVWITFDKSGGVKTRGLAQSIQ
jgi:hypothetical protein